MQYLLALDLETTGLDYLHHEIMQIAAIVLDPNLNQLGQFYSLVKIDYPERGIEISKDNTSCDSRELFNVYQYTGIDPKKLETAPILSKVMKSLVTFIKKNTKFKTLDQFKDISIFGQNPQFDKLFLKQAFIKCDIDYKFDYHVIGLDTIYTFFNLVRYNQLPEKIMLKDICNKLHIINENQHNALNDLCATIAAFKYFQKEIKGNK